MTELAAQGRGLLLAALPVVEIFGPTIQGEGTLAGLPTYFVRFGGCDYRCSWCDSLHAVLPAQVRANAERLYPAAILDRIAELPDGPEWITLSGGNPALLELGGLVEALHARDFKVAVETQGSKWRGWLEDVDCLTVSPKPPSAGMADKVDRDLARFMRDTGGANESDALKIVVFDDADYEWAREILAAYPDWPAFLSCGTDPPAEGEDYTTTLVRIGDRYRWLCERAAGDPALARARILPQMHVWAWGHARGV